MKPEEYIDQLREKYENEINFLNKVITDQGRRIEKLESDKEQLRTWGENESVLLHKRIIDQANKIHELEAENMRLKEPSPYTYTSTEQKASCIVKTEGGS